MEQLEIRCKIIYDGVHKKRLFSINSPDSPAEVSKRRFKTWIR